MTALQTRKPTGLPSWPILLLAGREKAGKSWAAVSASASPLIGRTLYIGIGEDDPDEYSIIPGADFEIVVHDGTYPGILAAIQGAVAEPAGEKPTLIIVDSMTRLWNLIGDNMQAIANRRAKGRKNAAGDFTISMDLWNVAADQWSTVMDALRAHQGPAILTARLDPVAVMENGQPTTQKEWKIQGHKSLPFDATAIIEMRERGQFLITGVKSARVQLDKPKPFPEFTVDRLWADLGIADGTAERTHATVQSDRTGAEPGAPREEAPVPAPVALVDWAKEIMPVRDLDALKAVHQYASREKELGLTVGANHKQSTLDLIKAWKLPAPQGTLTISALIQMVKAKIEAGQVPAIETTGGGAAADGDHPEATGAPAAATPGPEQGNSWPVAEIPKGGE